MQSLISNLGENNQNQEVIAKSIPDNFFYHTEGTCNDGTLVFANLSGAGLMLWDDPAAVLTGQIELYLKKDDGSYQFRYREFDFDGNTMFDQYYSGHYAMDSDTGKIQMDDLGYAYVKTTPKRSYYDITFDKILNDSKIKNQTLRFRVFKGHKGLHTDMPTYCNL
ncbi:hypothetical protein [Bdellovibrio sp. NC01]|uniref:hypothetical protein n=1 Tax=Bdellovibrio sp. NC01 TaxID=2220073 RepID=UPI0011593645|nr:hypothetical protein [Bdellovibrio sp. NC01]QDK39198.1 hypothetical protein DOE51_17180 [Bdellovibrio sp. NC01]